MGPTPFAYHRSDTAFHWNAFFLAVHTEPDIETTD